MKDEPNKRIKLARRSADVVMRNRRARSLSAVRWVEQAMQRLWGATMKVLLATTILVLALLFSACGGSTDPYVGTWALDDPMSDDEAGRDLVIAPAGQGYLLAFGEGASLSEWLPMTQRGEELVVDTDGSVPQSMQGRDITLYYDAADKRLLYTEGAVMRLPYVKVSDSTSLPSPSD